MPLLFHRDSDSQRAKRDLRSRIARSRRRIDRQVRRVGGEARQLTSWRTYVSQFPAAAIGSAFAAGFLLTSGRVRSLGAKLVVARVVELVRSSLKSQLWDGLISFWNESAPQGAEHSNQESQTP